MRGWFIQGVAALAITAGAIGAAHAGRGDHGIDHEEARRLMQAGEIQPLEVLVDHARGIHPGRVLETELKRWHDRYVYEIEIVDDNGVVWELLYDAPSGRLLKNLQDD